MAEPFVLRPSASGLVKNSPWTLAYLAMLAILLVLTVRSGQKMTGILWAVYALLIALGLLDLVNRLTVRVHLDGDRLLVGSMFFPGRVQTSRVQALSVAPGSHPRFQAPFVKVSVLDRQGTTLGSISDLRLFDLMGLAWLAQALGVHVVGPEAGKWAASALMARKSTEQAEAGPIEADLLGRFAGAERSGSLTIAEGGHVHQYCVVRGRVVSTTEPMVGVRRTGMVKPDSYTFVPTGASPEEIDAVAAALSS